MKKLSLLLLLLIALCGLAQWWATKKPGSTSPASAADRYVRAGASGLNNGTDWTNAWASPSNVAWTQVGTGTIYIGAGTYTSSFPVMTTAATVKRATVSVHGTDVGWNAAYDGQVTFNPTDQVIMLDANGGTLDGAGGCGQPWKFRINGSPGPNGQIGLSGNNLTIRGIEMDGSSRGGGEDAFRGGWSNDQINDLLIECSYIHDYSDYAGRHNDGIQLTAANRVTIRYNIWANAGQHIFLGDNDWCGSGCWVNDTRIYYNIFYNTIGSGWGSYNTIACKDCNQNPSNYMRVFNNVFAMRASDLNQPGFRNALSGKNVNTTLLEFRNNILVDVRADAYGTHTHNLYFNLFDSVPPIEAGRVTVDPRFVNYVGHNYQLQPGSPAIDAGVAVGLLKDFAGAVVPGGLAPDIGAFEVVGAAPPPPPPPPPERTPETDLLGSYCFNEPSGATAGDSSGNNNHLTIGGATRRQGKYGGGREVYPSWLTSMHDECQEPINGDGLLRLNRVLRQWSHGRRMRSLPAETGTGDHPGSRPLRSL